MFPFSPRPKAKPIRRKCRKPVQVHGTLRIEALEPRNMLSITVDWLGDESAVDPSMSEYTAANKITLRSAIERANYTGDEIGFNVTGTIQPGSALPVLTHDGITIRGPSEYGIILDGTSAGSGASGLVITASDCVIEGLIIQNFAGAGIKIDGSGSDPDVLVLDMPLFTGALDEYSPASLTKINGSEEFSVVDTLNSAHGNLITGNTIQDNISHGILISHASVNTITGNSITGTSDGPGIEIVGDGSACIVSTIDIGGNSPSAIDLYETITITSDANRNTISGNTIEDNHTDGILIDGASYNTIGGGESGDGNTITGNGANGIQITGEVTEIWQDGDDVTDGRQWIAQSQNSSAPEQSEGGGEPVAIPGFPSIPGLAARFAGMFGMIGYAFDPTYYVISIGAIPTYNRIQRNFIGTNADGDSGLGNQLNGILVGQAARLTVIGSEGLVVPSNNSSMPAEGNVIGSNGENGIKLEGQPLNEHSIVEPEGNYGDHGGSEETFSLDGQDFENNIPVFELIPTIIAGNTIGADPSGAHALGNTTKGVYLLHSRAFVMNNVIVASGGAGLEIRGAPQFSLYIPSDDEIGALNLEVNSIVQGNRVGVGWDGARLVDDEDHSLGNGGDGVVLAGGAQFNNIGASTDDTDEQPDGARDLAQRQGNVISHNAGWGVHVAGLGVFHVEGPFTNGNRYLDPFLYPAGLAHPYGTLLNSFTANLIGVDASGVHAAGNGLGGILVDQAAAFTVIGDIVGPLEQQWYGNVISANGFSADVGPGVMIAGRGTMVNVLGGNFIGLGYDRETGQGDTALGNNGPGVWIAGESTANNVGGDVLWPSPGSRNYIAANNGPGVLVENAYDLHLAILRNPPPGYSIGDFNPDNEVPLSGHVTSTEDNRYFTNVIDNCWIGLGVQIGFDETTGLANSWTAKALDPDEQSLGNQGDGVRIVDSSNTGLGAAHPGCTTNTIAGNQGNGVAIIGTESNNKAWLNFLTQSYIGTDPTGLAGDVTFANSGNGVLIEGTASYNGIQGAGTGSFLFAGVLDYAIAKGHVPAEVRVDALKATFDNDKTGNVISNNGENGIEINGAKNNVIGGGNFIGVGVGDEGELPNGANGVLITGDAQGNLVVPWARVDLAYPYDPDDPDSNPPFTYTAKASIIRGNTGAGIKIEGEDTSGNIVSGTTSNLPIPIYPTVLLVATNQITGNAEGDFLITDGASNNEVHGGPGNNHFILESGSNVAFGEEGDDDFDLGLGRSIVVGGAGADTIHESSYGENIVITGDIDLSAQEFGDVVAEWFTTGTGHDFADRVDNLSDIDSNYGGSGFLIAGLTVFDDGEQDVIVNEKVNYWWLPNGGLVGKTWYFVGFAADKYYSEDAPASVEVFTNVSPATVTVAYSTVSTDPVVLTLDAGDAVRYVVDGEVESTVALYAPSFGYSYLIDWDRDGTPDDTVAGGAGPVQVHDDFTASDAFVAAIQVKSARTPAGPLSVFVGGTDQDDDIHVYRVSGTTHVNINNGSVTYETTDSVEYFAVSTQDGWDDLVVAGFTGATGFHVDLGAGEDSAAIHDDLGGRYTLLGGAGDDTLAFVSESGRAEQAFVDGGEDNDFIFVVYADGGDYLLEGGAGADAVFFFGGVGAHVTMSGSDGDDNIVLAGGDNITALLDGGDGKDYLLDVSGSSTTITALGGAGDDVILGGLGSDYLDGGSGDDLIVGGFDVEMDGGDTLLGGGGNDVLIGSGGADSIGGGAGEDIIVSGSLTEDFFGEEETPGVVQVWHQWLISDDFTVRIGYISGVLEDPEFLDEAFLLQSDGSTFLDDDAVDTIMGGGDYDWFIYHYEQDVVLDLGTGDVEWEIAPE